MKEKVIVITINYNQSQLTIDCVDSILRSTCDNFQVFLIDNGSEKEDYLKLVETYLNENKVEILRIEINCGYVGGVNHGLKNASLKNPDYYLIMNNDTLIDKDAVKILVESAKQNCNEAIITGTVLDFNFTDTIQTTGTLFSDKRYLKEVYPYKSKDINQLNLINEEERDMIDDVFWIIPKEVFLKTGLYPDCYFLYAEQADYALSAVRNGFKLIFTPKAKLWHKGSITTGGGDRQAPHVAFWRNKSSTIYLFRNINKRYFLFFILKSLLKQFIKTVLNFVKRKKPNNPYYKLTGILYGLAWIIHRKPDNGYNPFLKK